MTNRFNYRCPKCGCPDEIEICSFVSLRLTSDGAEITDDVTDIDGPNDYWSSENAAGCDACGLTGAVKDFEPTGATVIELFGSRKATRR
jgi:hypothetical protein